MSYVAAKKGNSSIAISWLVHLHVQYQCGDRYRQQGLGFISNKLSESPGFPGTES